MTGHTTIQKGVALLTVLSSTMCVIHVHDTGCLKNTFFVVLDGSS